MFVLRNLRRPLKSSDLNSTTKPTSGSIASLQENLGGELGLLRQQAGIVKQHDPELMLEMRHVEQETRWDTKYDRISSVPVNGS
jgi:hypothetical protein